MRRGKLLKTDEKQTTADLQVFSTRERAFDGDFVVRLGHASLGEPIDFPPDGAKALAVRLCAAGELAQRGVEASLRLHDSDGEDRQCLVEVECFDGGIELNLASFQIRTCPRGAVRLACRLAYAAELAEQQISYDLTEGEMNNNLMKAAYSMLMARATNYLVDSKNSSMGGNHDQTN